MAALDDKLEAEFDALMAIGHLTSRQEARLSAVLRERAELIERKKGRAARKTKKRRKKSMLSFCWVAMHLALCSLLFSSGPGCSASWPVWTRRTVFSVSVAALVFNCGSGLFWAGFAGDTAVRCVPFGRQQARDARHFGRYRPDGQCSV